MTAHIGVSLALTGPEAAYAAQMRHAIDLAVEDEARDHRFAVELTVVDDRADADGADAAAARLVASGVGGVIGPMNSWTCANEAPAFAEAGLAQLTPSASNPSFSRAGWRTFFRLCPSDFEQGRVLAVVAQSLVGAQSVAAVHDGTAFAAPLALAFLEAARRLGLRPVADVVAEDNELAATAIAAAAPDAVLIAGLEEPNRRIASAIRSIGCRAVFLGTDAIKPTNALVTSGNVPGPFLTNASTDAAQSAPAFHRRFIERFGPHHSIYTVEAYDGLRLLARAVREAGSCDRSAVLGAIRRAGSYDGLSGQIAFDEAGERVAPCLGVYRWNGAGLTFLGTETARV